jgi:hypothetical protein
MLRILFPVLILSFFSVKSYSQILPNEVDVGLVNLYNPLGSTSQNNMLGMRYKYHFNWISIRVGMDFFYDENENKLSNNPNEYFQKSNNMKFILGAEKRALTNKKLHLYYGLDCYYSYNISKFKNFMGINFSENKTELEAVGLSPLAGMRFFVTENISFGTEIKVSLEGYENISLNRYNDVENKTKTTGTTFYMSPLGIISLNIHF